MSDSKPRQSSCQVEMGYKGPPCGRQLHSAPKSVDKVPVCLMHSNDLGKGAGHLAELFKEEFSRVLQDAGTGTAHFERFIFIDFEFKEVEIDALCRFDHATFVKATDFTKATFKQYADFQYVHFKGESTFEGVVFAAEARFYNAVFEKKVTFNNARFEGDAFFTLTWFWANAYLGQAAFGKRAVFSAAKFEDGGSLHGATFALSAEFNLTSYGIMDFRETRFTESASFKKMELIPFNSGAPSLVFAGAKFKKPDETVFDNVDLGRALLRGCNLSQVSFGTNVTWGRLGSRRSVVFDEVIPLEQSYAWGVRVGKSRRDHRAVAEVYQQLKKNYDARLDYWTADEFHFGEMEMKRIAEPGFRRIPYFGSLRHRFGTNRFTRTLIVASLRTRQFIYLLRTWWHENLSLVALYRWGSDYGNNYQKPLAWLAAVLLLASALYPLPGCGLQTVSATPSVADQTYQSVWPSQSPAHDRFWAEAKLAGKSLLTSIDVATFQKGGEYAPAYPWGRTVSIVEALLTSTLFALFLLAIRRQFRR